MALRIIRLAISFGLLAVLAFAIADPRDLALLIGRVRLPELFLATAIVAGDRVLMAYKWRLLLLARRVPLDLWTAIRAYFAATFAGLLLPVTVGADAIRVLAVRRFGVYDVAASIFVERLVGAVAVATLAMACSTFVLGWLSGLAPRRVALLVTAAALVGLVGFIVSLWLVGEWIGRRLGDGSRLSKFWAAYLAYREHPSALLLFYFLSVFESLLPVFGMYVIGRGLGLDLPLGVLVATIPVALTIARLPISLGGFGVQELSFVYLVGLFGIPATEGLAVMLVADAVFILTLLPSAFDTSMLNLRRSES